MTQMEAGASYPEVFNLLAERTGAEVDVEQAIEIWKMHFVQSIVSSFSGKTDEDAVFSVKVERDEPPRYLSWKVLSVEILSKLLEGLKRSREKLVQKIESLDQKISRIKGYIATKPFNFGDDGQLIPSEAVSQKKNDSSDGKPLKKPA
jgi:hypothetical protein